jgi:hypothetical protein
MRSHAISALLVLGLLIHAQAADAPIHGLWVWKTSTILVTPGSAEALRDFAKAHEINEVYVSVSSRDPLTAGSATVELLKMLHQSAIRVEALLDSIDADKAGAPREALLAKARAIVAFNATQTAATRFDGIHLDVEPQQRAENKGPGNLQFLPGLIDAFRDVHVIAGPVHLTVNADVANKVLKADAAQRRAMLTSVDRVTLMLYELSSPNDGKSPESKVEKLQHAAERYLDMTYDGLNDGHLAPMVIGLRTADYTDRMPAMLATLQAQQSKNAHYTGWAWHCYNDLFKF